MTSKAIKAVLFDLDGVVVTSKELFSDRLIREYWADPTSVKEFFTGPFRECSFGREDLKEALVPFLSQLNYPGTVEDFMQYWFQDVALEKEVVDIVQKFRKQKVPCYIATRQEKYRKEYLLHIVWLEKYFDGAFITCDIGFDKSDLLYWKYVMQHIFCRPEEILFICDGIKNIKMAESIGVQVILFEGIQSLVHHRDVYDK